MRRQLSAAGARTGRSERHQQLEKQVDIIIAPACLTRVFIAVMLSAVQDRKSKMKKKEKRFDARRRWPFIAFLVLVIAILSGLLLWQSQQSQEAELQKMRSAEDFCITNGLNRTDAQLADCIQTMLSIWASFEAGVSPEEIVAALGSAPYATQVSQRSATEISQRQARATEISQNPHRATETIQRRLTEESQWSATQISQRRQRLTEVSQQ